MRAEAKRPLGRAWQIPEPIGGARVGWFAGSGLVFAEGRACPDGLCAPSRVPVALSSLRSSLARHGIVLPSTSKLGFRRLDLAVDLRFPDAVDGVSILEQAAAGDGGKFAVYRAERRVETVVLMSPSGKAKARVYDKGLETGSAGSGRWLRFEAQWLFPRHRRPPAGDLRPEWLREHFASRFKALGGAGSPSGDPLGKVVIARRLAGAVDRGEVLPSRARSLVGYLFLARSGIPQGARRTVDELERECRELGLSLHLRESAPDELDLATILESCVASDLWTSEP